MREHLRTVRLRPYLKDQGPSFTLITWSTDQHDSRGQTRIAYELRMHERSSTSILFSGSDFCGSPMHSDDSDASIGALLYFLTLRPGDTDREYFANYTPEQLAFASHHAEVLSCEVLARFGDC